MGTSTSPFLTGTKMVSRPEKNAMNVGAALDCEVIWELCPGTGFLILREGYALTGRAGLVDGQVVMNAAAKVKTSFKSSGTYK